MQQVEPPLEPTPSENEARGSTARLPEVLDVTLERLLPVARGRLAEVIGDAIERELHTIHAPPPGIGSSHDDDSALSDRLFRARQMGASRVSLTLPTLLPLADDERALGADDSKTLVFWTRATRERPVTLTLDPRDGELSLHVKPVPIGVALGHVTAAVAPPAPEPGLRPPTPLLARQGGGSVKDEARGPARDHSPVPPALPGEAGGQGGGFSAVPTTKLPPASLTATLALTAARGPQPLAALERLFAASYLPLDSALRDPSHPQDARATRARDDFKDNFSRVYTEAFHAFAVTGKRPKMILDAPATAARIARQTSAKSAQLLLVDGLRYDLGGLVKDALVLLLAQKATLTHEMILWSALPTTTTHQLATLIHGVVALKAEPTEEREDGPLRGRTAQTIRRVKLGSRVIHRLDLCDVRVREAGDRVLPLLPSIGNDVAATIAKYAATLAPRTLLFVFGDHGFTLDRDGTPLSGGSSPEEVLVPAFAFLMGEAH